MFRIFIIILFIAFVQSCKDDSDDLPANFEGYQYYPLFVGQSLVYTVDSVVYDDFTQEIDTFSFFLKEEVESTFLDASNRKAFRVEVYTRLNDTLNWKLQRVISKLRTDLRAEEIEENSSTVPLVFPIKETAVWDLNILNVSEELKCKYKNIYQAFDLYDSTVTVEQDPRVSLIEQKTSEEVYAANIGLVYVKKKDLKLDFNTSEIISGYDVEKRLLGSN